VLLDPGGRFQTDICRTKNEFMQNLILAAVDECHCIYSWEDFRPVFGHIGKLRFLLANIPFALFSATLMPHVASYVATVCNLSHSTILFSLSIRRDNIKLAVIPIDDIGDTRQLFKLLNLSRKRIPKSLIFMDNVHAASTLALQMKAKLAMANGKPEGVRERIFSDTVIGGYWSEIDDRRKKKVMENFKKGITRIVVGTDAISLGLNVDDVDVTIQWGVTENLTLDILWQRMGRGGRGKDRQSYGLIFVKRKLLEPAPGGWEAAFKLVGPQPAPTSEDLDRLQLKTVPVCKGRDLAKFTLPVTPETMTQVNTHLDGLYREVADIKKTFKLAEKERTGTNQQPVSAVQKIDPFSCWFCNSDGCLHQVIKVAFREPGNLFANTSEGWDCDRCARAMNLDPKTPLPCGLTLGDTMAYQLKYPVPGQSELSKVAQSVRPDKMNASRTKELKEFLIKWRKEKLDERHYPLMILPCIILPDFVISRIVKDITHIVTLKQLRRSLKAADFDVTSSLLTATDLLELLKKIEEHLHSTEKGNTQKGIILF